MLFGVLRFALFALAGECGVLAVIWLGVALQGPIYTFTMVAGRLFLDKRVPDTMRGQAQALYQLLVGSVAGIIGAFFCGWLYESQSEAGVVQWTPYWLILAAMTLIPLAYFFIGLVGKPSRPNQ